MITHRTPADVAFRGRVPWVLVLSWMVVIAWGSLAPGVGAPAGMDLVVHAAAYLVLAWLLRNALGEGGRRPPWLVAGGLACGYGVIMEALQGGLIYRSAEIGDLVANAAGAAIGVAVPFGRRGERGS